MRGVFVEFLKVLFEPITEYEVPTARQLVSKAITDILTGFVFLVFAGIVIGIIAVIATVAFTIQSWLQWTAIEMIYGLLGFNFIMFGLVYLHDRWQEAKRRVE